MFKRFLNSGAIVAVMLGCSCPGLSQKISSLLTNYVLSHHQEKIYVAHDRGYYAPGETIWCLVHMVDGIHHQAFKAKPIVYVRWLDPSGEVQRSYTLKVVDGTAQFDIKTDKADPEGDYRLQVFTLYQRNFDEAFIFQKTISLRGQRGEEPPSESRDDKHIAFYPEGGHLVNGLESKVGFRVFGSLDVDMCSVVDDRGITLGSLVKMHEDFGVFTLLPDEKRSYFVVSNDGVEHRRFRLPAAISQGYIITASSTHDEHITVRVAASHGQDIAGCQLIGHVRGTVFLDHLFSGQNASGILIPKVTIPSGIVHFTLFDTKGRPVAERLIFNHNVSERPMVRLAFDRDDYGPRTQVHGDIGVHLEDKPVASRMSVSVVKKLSEDEGGTMGLNIVNYLLLQSDVDLPIQSIHQYFQDDDSRTRAKLDLLLMTLGWRKFNWQDVLENKRPDLVFRAEESLSIMGRVTEKKSSHPVKADVTLHVLDEDDFSISRFLTEDDGVFLFTGLRWRDSTEIIIQAEEFNEKKKKKLKEGEIRRTGKKNVDIHLIEPQEFEIPGQYVLPAARHPDAEELEDFNERINFIQKVDSTFNPEWQFNLDEFTVTAQRKTQKELNDSRLKDRYKRTGIPFVESSFKVYTDDLPGSGSYYTDIYDLIRARVPGATVTGSAGSPRRDVFLRSGFSISLPTHANFIVNGVPTDYTIVASIHPARVLAIDVMRGLHATAFYGEKGAGGIISITMREPEDRVIQNDVSIKGILNLKHPGYYQARTFASPDYGPGGENDLYRPDYRNTLYWSGEIVTDDSKGKAECSFYTGDESGIFEVRIEGITTSGCPFTHFGEITVAPRKGNE